MILLIERILRWEEILVVWVTSVDLCTSFSCITCVDDEESVLVYRYNIYDQKLNKVLVCRKVCCSRVFRCMGLSYSDTLHYDLHYYAYVYNVDYVLCPCNISAIHLYFCCAS
jgi:hypothetical protein